MNTSQQRLDQFHDTYDKGRGWVHQALWFATLNLLFRRWWLPPGLRPPILRVFGAHVGRAVHIRHNVRIHWPWKLRMGSNVWIGEGAWLLNLEPLEIGDNVCISQEALVCTGGHNPRDGAFGFANAQIVIEAGAWLGARSIVRAGSHIGRDSCVAAGTTAPRIVPTNMILRPAPDLQLMVERFE